jgi:hypothetical protein
VPKVGSLTKLLGPLLVLSYCFASPAAAAPQQPPPGPPMHPDEAHETFVPYWTAEPGWHTELQLRNNLDQGELVVTPVLRLADGRSVKLSPVTIPPASAVSVNTHDALASLAPTLLDKLDSFGGASFLYTSPTAKNLYASVMLHMDGRPIGYHVDGFPIAKVSVTPRSREGVWWLPYPQTKDILVISNGSETAVTGTLSLYDAAGKEWQTSINLPAYQSKKLVVSQLILSAGLTGNYGGIKFLVPNSAAAISSIHFIYDPVVGFSAQLKMFSRDPMAKFENRVWAGNQQWTLWAPMLALRTPDPVVGFPRGTMLEPTVLIHNTTAKTITANMSLDWRGDSTKGKAKLDLLTLKPFETLHLNIGSMQSQLAIPDDAHWALVTLTTPASPDDLIAVAASYDSTGRYGAQTPFSDQLAEHWVGGNWQADPTHTSLVAVTNGGAQQTDALLTIFFDGGKQKYEIQQSIAPGQQMWLNIGDLIGKQVPDRMNRILPLTLTSGTYELRDLKPGLGHGGNLFEGKIIVDKTWGYLAYGCMLCCGYSNPRYLPDRLFLPVGLPQRPQA